jgi:hypothetical protein
MTAFLGEIGGREIDGDALGRHGEARRIQCGADSFARFSDRLVAETDHREDHVPIGDLHLHVHRPRLDAFKRNRRNSDDHSRPAFPLPGELNEETVPLAILYLSYPKNCQIEVRWIDGPVRSDCPNIAMTGREPKINWCRASSIGCQISD